MHVWSQATRVVEPAFGVLRVSGVQNWTLSESLSLISESLPILIRVALQLSLLLSTPTIFSGDGDLTAELKWLATTWAVMSEKDERSRGSMPEISTSGSSIVRSCEQKLGWLQIMLRVRQRPLVGTLNVVLGTKPWREAERGAQSTMYIFVGPSAVSLDRTCSATRWRNSACFDDLSEMLSASGQMCGSLMM